MPAAAATSDPRATAAAVDVLRDGGNAVDAAVAAALVLYVVEPQSAGVGGDAFLIVVEPGRRPVALDGSGALPLGLTSEALAADGSTPCRYAAPGPPPCRAPSACSSRRCACSARGRWPSWRGRRSRSPTMGSRYARHSPRPQLGPQARSSPTRCSARSTCPTASRSPPATGFATRRSPSACKRWRTGERRCSTPAALGEELVATIAASRGLPLPRRPGARHRPTEMAPRGGTLRRPRRVGAGAADAGTVGRRRARRDRRGPPPSTGWRCSTRPRSGCGLRASTRPEIGARPPRPRVTPRTSPSSTRRDAARR